jgi:hypothetical protein
MSVALPALRRPPVVVVTRHEARWVLYALYLTAVIVGFQSGHPVGSVLLGLAVLTQDVVRRRFHLGSRRLIETARTGK